MHRILGGYLIGVAIAQVIVYVAMLWGARTWWLDFLDPRFGLTGFERLLRFFGAGQGPGVSSWASAAILGAIGGALLRNPSTVKLYLAVEAALATPSLVLLTVGSVVAIRLGPGDGLSVRELVVFAAAWLIASVVPFVLGLRLAARLANPPLQSTNDQDASI